MSNCSVQMNEMKNIFLNRDEDKITLYTLHIRQNIIIVFPPFTILSLPLSHSLSHCFSYLLGLAHMSCVSYMKCLPPSHVKYYFTFLPTRSNTLKIENNNSNIYYTPLRGVLCAKYNENDQ